MQFGHSLTEKSGLGKLHLADFENNQIFLIRTKSKILFNPNNFIKKTKVPTNYIITYYENCLE